MVAITSAYCMARLRSRRSVRSPCMSVRASLLAVGSLARECDRRKLFTPAECRKFGRALSGGTLYDYPKLARVRAALRYEKNPRLTRCQKKTHAKWKKTARAAPLGALVMQPILQTRRLTAAFVHFSWSHTAHTRTAWPENSRRSRSYIVYFIHLAAGLRLQAIDITYTHGRVMFYITFGH